MPLPFGRTPELRPAALLRPWIVAVVGVVVSLVGLIVGELLLERNRAPPSPRANGADTLAHLQGFASHAPAALQLHYSQDQSSFAPPVQHGHPLALDVPHTVFTRHVPVRNLVTHAPASPNGGTWAVQLHTPLARYQTVAPPSHHSHPHLAVQPSTTTLATPVAARAGRVLLTAAHLDDRTGRVHHVALRTYVTVAPVVGVWTSATAGGVTLALEEANDALAGAPFGNRVHLATHTAPAVTFGLIRLSTDPTTFPVVDGYRVDVAVALEFSGGHEILVPRRWPTAGAFLLHRPLTEGSPWTAVYKAQQ